MFYYRHLCSGNKHPHYDQTTCYHIMLVKYLVSLTVNWITSLHCKKWLHVSLFYYEHTWWRLSQKCVFINSIDSYDFYLVYHSTIAYGRHLNLIDCYEQSSSQSGWLLRMVVISIWLTVTNVVISIWLTVTNGRHLNLVDCHERSSSKSGWLLRTIVISIWLTYERSSSQSGWLLRTVVISIWSTATNGRHLNLVDWYERYNLHLDWP